MAIPMRAKKKPVGMAVSIAVGKPKDEKSPFGGLFGKHPDEETPEEESTESPEDEAKEEKDMIKPKMSGSVVDTNIKFKCPCCGEQLSVEPATEAAEEHEQLGEE